jgi:hypothetical protein
VTSFRIDIVTVVVLFVVTVPLGNDLLRATSHNLISIQYVLYVHGFIMDVWNLLLALVYTESVGTRLRWHCRSGAPCGGTWPHSSERWLQQSALHRLHPMPTFPSRPLKKSPLHLRLKKNPAIFGVPFLLVMVGASFGLQAFTQTRYDLHSQKVTQVRTLDIYSISFVHVHHSFIHPF